LAGRDGGRGGRTGGYGQREVLARSAECDTLRASRHAIAVVGDGQRAGERAGGRGCEGHVDRAGTAGCDAGPAIVGLAEVGARGHAGDGERGVACVAQGDRLRPARRPKALTCKAQTRRTKARQRPRATWHERFEVRVEHREERARQVRGLVGAKSASALQHVHMVARHAAYSLRDSRTLKGGADRWDRSVVRHAGEVTRPIV